MPISAGMHSLQRSIAELRSAVDALARTHGDSPVVARLRGDLDRLVLDAADVPSLSPFGTPAAAGPLRPGETVFQMSDEPYDTALWKEEADDEGVGGYRGQHR